MPKMAAKKRAKQQGKPRINKNPKSEIRPAATVRQRGENKFKLELSGKMGQTEHEKFVAGCERVGH
jgi:hypothetical protein